jgi:hypothetical protein
MTVLAHGVPDRVPISTYEMSGYNSKSFENIDPSYKTLMDAIRAKTDCVSMWDPEPNTVFLESAYPAEIDVEQRREGDTTITKKTLHTPKGDLTQTTKVIDNIHTVWEVEHWCKSIEDVEKALSVPYEPVRCDFSDYARIKEEVGERGIIMSSTADPLWLAAALMDFGSYTLWALTETDHFVRTMDLMHERYMENLRRMMAVEVVDLYRICGPEYATPPYMPPELFTRFVEPYVTEMVELIHSKGSLARLHSHGKVREALDTIVRTGCDAIDPCEAPPDGDITLAEVKRRVGDKLCIFGNLQLKMLEQATEEEVVATVKKCMEEGKPGGGFVAMTTASPINSPLSKKTERNYLRFFETALEYGVYD